MWNPAGMPSMPEVPAPLADGLVIVTAVLAVGMAVSNVLTKRLGPAAAILGLAALVCVRTPLALGLEAGLLALWLVGRGIPSRRRRPAWVLILAVVVAVLAIAGVVAVVG